LPAHGLAIGFQHTWSKLRALIRHVRLQMCDESLNVAGQWWAAKLHIHRPDRTKTLYTLLVSGENSIHFGRTLSLFVSFRHTYQMQNDEDQSSRSIHNIVYCSRAVHDMDKEALEKIISTARHHNPRFGITGLLVFGSGCWRRLNFDHLCRLNLDQGLLLI
jgi:hypothetical protein